METKFKVSFRVKKDDCFQWNFQPFYFTFKKLSTCWRILLNVLCGIVVLLNVLWKMVFHKKSPSIRNVQKCLSIRNTKKWLFIKWLMENGLLLNVLWKMVFYKMFYVKWSFIKNDLLLNVLWKIQKIHTNKKSAKNKLLLKTTAF